MDTRHSLARLAAIVLNYRTPADTLAAVASLRASSGGSTTSSSSITIRTMNAGARWPSIQP